jgi:hypothetical protein
MSNLAAARLGITGLDRQICRQADGRKQGHTVLDTKKWQIYHCCEFTCIAKKDIYLLC